MAVNPQNNSKNEERAALRASLAQIETAARLAQQAIDTEQPASVLGQCIDDLDHGFEAFDRARVDLNKQQVAALNSWDTFAEPEEQGAEEVIEEWRQEMDKKRRENGD